MEATLDASFQSLTHETTLIKQIRSGTANPIPFPGADKTGIQRALLPHQILAINHGLSTFHPANFSVPGSGKTTVALSIFAAMKVANRVTKLFVIGPASCFAPWIEEYERVFARKPASLRLVGNRTERRNWIDNLDSSELILCTYQMAHREKDNIIRALKLHGHLLILDESHYVKNMRGAWAATILELAPLAKHRMILSGTPAPYSLQDLWTQFTFLWPSQALLGKKHIFEKVTESVSAATKIRNCINPFFVRTSKADLNLPVPNTVAEKISYRSIPNRQRTIVRLLEEKTLIQIADSGGKLPGNPEISCH